MVEQYFVQAGIKEYDTDDLDGYSFVYCIVTAESHEEAIHIAEKKFEDEWQHQEDIGAIDIEENAGLQTIGNQISRPIELFFENEYDININ